MIVDAEALGETTTLETDVCIVGGGAAGIALARALAAQGVAVTLLEGGGFQRERFSTDLYRGEVGSAPLAHTSGYLTASRLRYWGGSTNHWTGWCRPLDALDFEPRRWIPHSGWPIRRAQLDPWYRRAAEVLEIEPFDRAPEGGDESADDAFPAAASAFRRARFHLSPPTRMGPVYRDELAASARVRVLLHANVVSLEADPDATRVRHVAVRTPAGRALRVTSRRVVLACGGIENARTLLVSNRVRPRGLGNDHDQVGRFFMDHPHTNAGHAALELPTRSFDAFVLHRPPGSRCEAIDVLSLAPSAQREQRLANCDVYLRPPEGELPHEVMQAARAFARLRGLGSGRTPPPRVVTLRTRLEPIPNPESRVQLAPGTDALGVPRARLTWRFSAADATNLEATLRALGLALGRGGFGRAQLLATPREPWPDTNFGAHHIGTTRMHEDARQGVVDADCRVHGLANLFIAGSSVFPTAGAANPTLTIVALALRLADHLGQGAGS